jgi:hypothetical protein
MAVQHALRSLSVYEEPNGSFGVDHYSTSGDFLAVPAQNVPTWSPDQPLLDPQTLQQYIGGHPLQVLGPRAGTMTVTVPLARTGILADTSTPSVDSDQSAIIRMLKSGFGGYDGDNQGSTSAVGSTASVINVQAGHGSRFFAGGAMGWVNPAGILEMREVEGVATDAVTVKHAFSAAPSNTNPIYNATTIYINEASPTSVQFRAIGKDADDAWAICGAQIQSIQINTPVGQIPTLSITYQFAEWINKGSGSLAGVTYSNFVPYAFNQGEFQAQVVATATRNIQCIREFSLQIGLTWTPVRCPNGVNTIQSFDMAHVSPMVQGSFGIYYADQTWHNAWINRTKYHLALSIPDADDGGVLITIPTAQIGPVTAPADAEGFSGQTVSFRGMLDEDTGAQTTALLRSPFRMHFFG